MPDRILRREAELIADIPGLEDEPVLVNVRDSIGIAIATDEAAEALGDGRYRLVIDASQISRSGVWNATFREAAGSRIVNIRFSVGPEPVSASTLYALRFQVGNEIEKAIESVVSSADPQAITDETLVGGAGNYRHWWLMLDPSSAESGKVRRVTGYNGTTLELSPPFLAAPDVGSHFTLYRTSPREIDRAIFSAIDEIATVSRIETQISGMPVINQIFEVPEGIRYINSVWMDDAELAPNLWTMLPGRRVKLSEGLTVSESTGVTITGIRNLTRPVWEDSTLDIEPGAVIARATQLLHAARAAGTGVDVDEHLRRQLASQDTFERALRRVSGRLVSGAKAVID